MLLSLNALRRMDYLNPETAKYIRMTDASRSALVGKHIAEGDGYKTNDLPASLIDFYDQRGKLHDEQWVNADRFPFTAYATAAFYALTQSTSETVGILLYNLVCFVTFLVLLYRLSRALFGQSWSAIIAVTIALLHPYTYVYLYLKDADMLLLTVGVMSLFVHYFRSPPESLRLWPAFGFGTLLAWTFLSRPNLGAPFVLAFVVIAVARYRRYAKQAGHRAALREYVKREGFALIIAGLWLVPFVIHSMSEWGSPLFSANNIYQLPLGTRYGMGTDTWWKYTQPGETISLGTILDGDRSSMIAKFTTSWVATLRSTVGAFGVELLLAFAMLWWLKRRNEQEVPARRPIQLLVVVIGFAALLNLLLLPMYGYKNYAYRHYIGFIFPIMWIAAGHAIYLAAAEIEPYARRLLDHVRKHPGLWLAIAAGAILVWNITSAKAYDSNRLLGNTSVFLRKHWLAAIFLMVVIAAHRWLLRPPWTPRVVALMFCITYACQRPDNGIKRTSLIWFPANDAVWTELGKRKGLVSSLALQGEVAWNTGRKNIPAPEWPMHIYSFKFDHDLDVEDLYIESASALLSTSDGPLSWMAPGFEGYERLQEYPGSLPGYELAFHETALRGYPKFRVKPRLKASTVYKLVDPAAVQAMRRSPDEVDLGDQKNVIFTAHGWGRYLDLDGRLVVAATDMTRKRYPGDGDGPWEDTSVTFFLDDRRPSSVELEFYAPHAATYTFYWNLDLYIYDRPGDRRAHQVGAVVATAPGWQTAILPIPNSITRKGLNKLGFRVSSFQPIVFCPEGADRQTCAWQALVSPEDVDDAPAITMFRKDISSPARDRVSMFVTKLVLRYETK